MRRLPKIPVLRAFRPTTLATHVITAAALLTGALIIGGALLLAGGLIVVGAVLSSDTVTVAEGDPAPSGPTASSNDTTTSDETSAIDSAAPSATPAPADPTPSAASGVDQISAPGTSLAQLDQLVVKGRSPKTGYDRDAWGWRSDTDRNGCDTRNDILRRDLTQIVLEEGTHGCVVLEGKLRSPYTDASINFDRANSTIDIDHVVALSDAWQTGAASWDDTTRHAFANDPLNLLAVESSVNRQKGDGDAATWLPSHKPFRCEYVSIQIAVKTKYDLWVKPAEADAMRRVLADCDGFLAVTATAWPDTGEGDVIATRSGAPKTTSAEAKTPAQKTSSEERKSSPSPKAKPKKEEKKKEPAKTSSGDSGRSDKKTERTDSASGDGNAYFKNCSAAREAGKAPLHRGDPGYRKGLDRDGDGIACE